jgi:branched-chain amino acid transport system substrate-binding protein
MDRRNVLKTLGIAAGTGTVGASSLLGTAAWAQANQPIKLGFISSLSGAQAPLGQPMLLGAEIAVDQINKAGGVNGRKLELVVRDDKAKPADATVAARELAGSGVNLMLGVVSSTVALAINAMLEQEKAILITCAAHSEKLTKENFVRNYFRVTDNPYMRERALAKMAAQRYAAVDRWTGIIPDHEYGRTTWGCFEDGLLEFYPSVAKKKPSITQPVKTPYGAPDYRSGIIAAMAIPAEGFFVSVYGGDAVTMFKQAEAFGFFKKAKVIIDSANELIVAKAMKQDLPDMWVGSHWYAGAFQDVAVSRELQAEAVRRTKDPLTMGFLAEGHAAVMAYAKAVQAAGSTETQAVIKALESVTFETATGPRNFRKEDHQAIKPVVMYHLRGSAKSSDGFEVLEHVRIPGAEVIDPPTPGKPLTLRKA